MIRSSLILVSSLFVIAGPLAPLTAIGGCCVPETDAAAFDESRAVAEVEVVSSEPHLAKDQSIQTRLILRLVERFKGEVPAELEITTPGGTLGTRTDFRSDSLDLKPGNSYVLLLNRDDAGIWSARPHHAYRVSTNRRALGDFFRGRSRGPRPKLDSVSSPATGSSQSNANGIPNSVVTPTGYSETGGQPTRFTTSDGDEPIPYLIDIDPAKLPTGMNQTAAVTAVADAFNAWAASSSLKFRYEGTVSFGEAASEINVDDRRLRIQLHDNFNAITNGSGTLGIGGGSFYSASSSFTGGRVGTQGFQERLFGYVVLESTTNASFMRDTANFKRVLTHEIGHALGLDHSSQNPSEPDAILKAATMYYTASTGSTGATIQAYDVDRIQFGYPVTNTPPCTTNRVLQAITTSNYSLLPAVLGVNRIQLYAFDRQGTPLTASLVSQSGDNGSFSLSGNTLIYLPNGNFGNMRLTDTQIEDGSYYDSAQIQFSDGVNLSPVTDCIITGFSNDTTPADGLPNNWMTANFNTTTPGAVGTNSHPDSDPDKDGLTNRVEFYLNTNPNVANSGPATPTYNHSTRRLSYTPVRFAPYRVKSSSSLGASSWTLRRVGTIYQANGALTSDFSADPVQQKQFYRVVTGP